MPEQPPDPRTITRLLQLARSGQAGATDTLLGLAYDQLRSLARARMSTERGDHTLQPTALVHEAWLRLAPHIDGVADQTHFFAIASQAMRRVLADHARGRNRQKRGGACVRVLLDPSITARRENGFDLVDLDDSLNRLGTLNKRHARVVELRVFGGLTIDETADALKVSHSTVETDWFIAKAWLRRELDRAG